jgi:hypothetical protein
MEWGPDWRPQAGDGGLLAPDTEGDQMIFRGLAWLGAARRGSARPGWARRGGARQYVTWYGNQDNFSGSGAVGLGKARRWRGKARQGNNACRWAVSPDTFGKQKQGNQSKTT